MPFLTKVKNNISGATEGFGGAGWRSQGGYLKWHLVHRTRRALVIHTLRARCRVERFAGTGKWCASALCEKQARKHTLWKVSAWVRLVKSRCASAHYETCVRKCALWPLNLCASVSCGQQVQVRNYKCTLWTELPMLCLIILYLVSNTMCINSTWHNNNNNNGTTSVLCGKQVRKSTSWKVSMQVHFMCMNSSA